MASQPTPLMPAAWEIASQIRTMREEAGLSAAALANRIGRSQAHVSRWETARAVPKESDLNAICQVLGVGPARQSRLMSLYMRTFQEHGHGPNVNQGLTQLIAFEEQASSMGHVAPLLVPGVLQTEGYARAIMSTEDISQSETENRVQARMSRQNTMLTNNVRVEALIADRALEAWPCSDDVMHDQLKHLLKLAERDEITIRRVPMGGHYTGMFSGSFLLLRFDRMAPVGNIEVHNFGYLITENRDVLSLERALSSCRKHADSPEDTRRYIEGVIQ